MDAQRYTGRIPSRTGTEPFRPTRDLSYLS